MPQLRKDPIVGRWLIVSTERARRPGNFIQSYQRKFVQEPRDCPFCQDHRDPLYCISRHGREGDPSAWDVCVIPAKGFEYLPKVSPEPRKHGLYRVMDGAAINEVIIESPEHVSNMADLEPAQIERVFKTYVRRVEGLKEQPGCRYATIYKNYGWSSGGRYAGHACSHLVGTSVSPFMVDEKLNGAKKYFTDHQKCVYCDMLEQDRKEAARIVHETEHFVALTPFAARFIFEVWVLPKVHNSDFGRGVQGLEKDLAGMMKVLLKKYQLGLDDPAYSYIIHTAPLLSQAMASLKQWDFLKEGYHWHIELMPRLTRPAGFEKGTGFHICSIPPEKTAEYLRETEGV